jgi:HSP20 family protein
MANPGDKKDKKKEVSKAESAFKLKYISHEHRGAVGKLARESDSATMDIYENKGFIFVEMELAGVNPDDFKVIVDRHKLSIEGVKAESALNGLNIVFHCAERSFGKFKRVFDLGSAIDAEKIEATFKNGVLRLKLPKLQDRRKTSHQIKVQVDD